MLPANIPHPALDFVQVGSEDAYHNGIASGVGFLGGLNLSLCCPSTLKGRFLSARPFNCGILVVEAIVRIIVCVAC